MSNKLIALECPQCGAALPSDNCTCRHCGSKVQREYLGPRIEPVTRRSLDRSMDSMLSSNFMLCSFATYPSKSW